MSFQSGNVPLLHSKEAYGDSFSTDLLEQYKLYVQSAENVSARRVVSNRYLLTLNAALVALYGLQSAGFGQSYWTLLVPVIGIPVSLLWYLIIKSHADLNRIKFDVIHEFEQHLPAAMYKYEWQLAEEGHGKAYRAVTTIERWIPILFAALHVVLAIMVHSRYRWSTGLDQMTTITEADVEEAALDWLTGLGWQVAHGPDIAPDTPSAERDDYGQVVLERRLRDALAELNPGLPPSALDDAFRKLARPDGSTLEARNRAFHRMLVDGVTVEHRDSEGRIRGAQVQIIDFDSPSSNDWMAVNQFTVTENRNTRRPDVVLFVNGLPLGVIELKNPADEDATIWTAWQQLQTYKSELPTLFSMNEALMVSDGTEARIGTLTSGREWFKPWRTITGETLADSRLTELQVMLEGVFGPGRFLSMVRDFIVFDDDGSSSLVKKMAGYHQFHAVKVAVDETLRAAKLQRAEVRIAEEDGRYEAGRKPGGELGDRRIGVVWHTQGSGKSLTMAFYAGAIVREPAMENPTVVVLTDRNDLDDQLFGTFSRCQDLLRQPPAQAESRADLRSKLSVNAGGVVFTTIQKFFPEEKGDSHPTLSERRNIVVIADEAHRSQYDFIDGYARHMRDALPNAFVCRLYRDAHRATGCQHARRVRRLHQHLRHPTFRRGRGHSAHLLREPSREAGLGRAGEAENRPGVRGCHRGRGG